VAAELCRDPRFGLSVVEVRAFHRAFRRWTGTTPAAYRAHRATG
jgi:hypothetical protein